MWSVIKAFWLSPGGSNQRRTQSPFSRKRTNLKAWKSIFFLIRFCWWLTTLISLWLTFVGLWAGLRIPRLQQLITTVQTPNDVTSTVRNSLASCFHSDESLGFIYLCGFKSIHSGLREVAVVVHTAPHCSSLLFIRTVFWFRDACLLSTFFFLDKFEALKVLLVDH